MTRGRTLQTIPGLHLPRVRLDQRLRHRDLVDAVFGERNADGVADAVAQERADADRALDAAVLAFAGLGDAEMDRVIPIRRLPPRSRATSSR